MSFKGQIEARCPKGCEAFTTEVWSFIRGDQSPELRDAILWRECNLILCETCSLAFFPENAYIYYEPPAELLAFVFPESYRAKEEFWRAKMREDFTAIKGTLEKTISLDQEPRIFFGHEELAELLEKEDYRGEEREVMEALAAELGMSLYQVSPSFSREQVVPRSLPFIAAKKGAPADRAAVVAGLEKLLAANDRLEEYKAFLERFKADAKATLPPPATTKPS